MYKRQTPSNAILVLDLRHELNDQSPQSPFGNLNAKLSVVEVVRKLEAAEHDGHVKGIFVRAPEESMAPAPVSYTHLCTCNTLYLR